MYKYCGKNIRPFSAVCDCKFGRKIIYTNARQITKKNIVKELNKALTIHRQNAVEIDYLDKYYRGDQPILYRKKDIRPDVNNKIVQNLALFIVETKTSEMAGEPIQYVLRGTDEKKSEEIANLNTIMEGEDKPYFDIELCRWRSICGTAYRFIGNDERHARLLDETRFYISTEDPRNTFVVYFNNGASAFSCQIRKDEEDKDFYFCYTDTEWFEIKNNEISNLGANGNYAIPVIEYPNNERRLSDIEITITITDNINKNASDRENGIEQFVASWIKFINCEVDKESYLNMVNSGALVVKSNNNENRADVDIMTQELNQTESQVAVNDQFEKMLIIQGLADRQANTGGDTQGAVTLRNGFYSMEKRSELSEPIFKRSERNMLRIVLNRLRITSGFSLLPSDVEIKISRTKSDNMQTKAQVLTMLLQAGVKYERALKTIGLFADPEQVAIESRKRMELLYPEEEKEEVKTRITEEKEPVKTEAV
ncbi:MAG: phage portal protein [Lachnospiraceae bacterium]|nr:phage portal protein [Lachnospiraceae bacterium]